MSKSKFKLEFTLKQHTPIIHFQSDQKGATLRASELKPSLDSFLIKEIFSDKNEYKDYLIAGQPAALDYRVKIEEKAEEKALISSPDDKLYLGNMGDSQVEQRFLKNGSIVVTIMSFHTKLIEVIKDNFASFLFQKNFGSRQSKGFGVYYLFDSENNCYLQPDLKNSKYKVYKFSSTRGKYEKEIALFYSFLRSGINYPCSENQIKEGKCPHMRLNAEGKEVGTRFYVKSALYNYLSDKTNITWDKKAIKHEYFLERDDPVESATLARDLFGLSTPQNWKSYEFQISKKDVKGKIKRFKSPVIFKPMIDTDIPASLSSSMTVYFWVDDSYSEMLGKTFKILKNGTGSLELSTPEAFDFNAFFDYVVKEYTLVVDSRYQQQDEYKDLKNILNQLEEVNI